MISQALKFSSQTLNQFVKNRMKLDENKVVLNNLIENNGSVPLLNRNMVVMSLINIEKETARPFNVRNIKLDNGNYAGINLSEKYNLDVLISTSFDDYTEGLKFLDAVLMFFQAHPYVDSQAFPGLPAGISKLEYENEKMSYHQMHNLWTAMGAKYQPSILYKIRLVTVQAGETKDIRTAVEQNASVITQ